MIRAGKPLRHTSMHGQDMIKGAKRQYDDSGLRVRFVLGAFPLDFRAFSQTGFNTLQLQCFA